MEFREKLNEWISLILHEDFLGKDIIKKQIEKAEVKVELGCDYCSVKFLIAEVVQTFPIHTRVPVEMICFQSIGNPIVFLLHIIDGKVNELEIITADSSHLDIDSIETKDKKYIYDPLVIKNV